MQASRLRQVNRTRAHTLVRAACTSENDAWPSLVARYDRFVRTIVRSYRLQPSDVDNVVQTTWMRLYQHIDRLREPAAITGWLATTARREAMRLLQAQVREQLTDDPELGDNSACEFPDAHILAEEDRLVLAQAIAALPERQRKLMTLLATQPDADYGRISATLGMPHGSIGPTRARGLTRLRRDPQLRRHHLGSA
ncbi:MAG: RNA polymerase sigma factor [Solirubrobacteraceae bacterium]